LRFTGAEVQMRFQKERPIGILAIIGSLAAFPTLTKAEQATSARVTENAIQVPDLRLNHSPDKMLAAKTAFAFAKYGGYPDATGEFGR
jgi:hypothetical protein